jgi:hypothetical protein
MRYATPAMRLSNAQFFFTPRSIAERERSFSASDVARINGSRDLNAIAH